MAFSKEPGASAAHETPNESTEANYRDDCAHAVPERVYDYSTNKQDQTDPKQLARDGFVFLQGTFHVNLLLRPMRERRSEPIDRLNVTRTLQRQPNRIDHLTRHLIGRAVDVCFEILSA
jgi:hypothetical protein